MLFWSRKRLLAIILATPVALAIVAVAGVLILSSAADRIVAKNAEEISMGWAHYLGGELMRLPEIASGGNILPNEKGFLTGVLQFGDVFRFKIFDIEGRLRIVSDELETR